MQEAPTMVAVRQDGEVLVITLLRDVGLGDEERLSADLEVLRSRLHDQGVRCLIVDFSASAYIASSLLSALVMLWKQVRCRNGRAAVCNLSANVRDVLHRTRLDTMWPVCASQQEALERMRSAECGMRN
jgi:anti-anti-sigma factor